MGDMADYYDDREPFELYDDDDFDDEFIFEDPKAELRRLLKEAGRGVIWETKELKRIPIKEMATSHIKNSIALINRKDGWRVEYLEPLKEELKKRV